MASLSALAERLVRRAPRLQDLPSRIGPWLESAREVLNFAAHRARDVRLAQVAGSLTFTTVLSLVPLFAVLLAVFTAVPMFAETRASFEKTVLRELLPEQYASLILRYLNDFASKAARLTAAGLVFLVFVALAMILTVDRVLNDIWQVRLRRPLLQRLLVYWTLLTLAPLLLGASLSASSYLLPRWSRWLREDGSLLGWALDYLPLLLSGFAFAALYVVVPARRVLWRDALIGGFIAALVGEAMKEGFAVYIRTGTVANVYGAFAVLPLFLLWVYLSWSAVLFGAAISATLPRLRSTRFGDERRAGNRFITAAALLRLLLRARAEGGDGGRMSTDALARAVRTYPEETERLLVELEKLDYVSRVVTDDDREPRWLLTCDPATRTLVPAFARFAIDPANTLAARDEAGLGAWVQRGLAAEWIDAPLESLLGAPGPGQAPAGIP
jgi:membrane protein